MFIKQPWENGAEIEIEGLEGQVKLILLDNPSEIIKYLHFGINIPIWKEFHEFILHDLNNFNAKSVILFEDMNVLGHILFYSSDLDTLYFGYMQTKSHNKFRIELLDGKKVVCSTVWDALCEEVNQYPLENVEEITTVPAKDIAEAARYFAQSKPASIHWGLPIDSTPGITPTAQAITNLWCITGNLDIPGGNIIARHAFDAVAYALPGAEGVIKLRSKEIDEKRIGSDTYGPFKKFVWRAQTDKVLEQIYSEKPYPIKGMWIQSIRLQNRVEFGHECKGTI